MSEIMEDEVSEAIEAEKRKPKPIVPVWETNVRERLKNLRHFQKPLHDLMVRDANEGDTRLLVTDILCEVLGYNKYSDLTTEYMVRGEFADYGIKFDGKVKVFIEVKRIGTKLNYRHMRQVEMYAVNEGVEWMILTNGAVWEVYHLTAGLPIGIDCVLAIDLLDQDAKLRQQENKLFYLSKESFSRNQIEQLFQHTKASSPESLLKAIMDESSLDAIRKSIKRDTGFAIETYEVKRLILDNVIDNSLRASLEM
jgi:predicted type IV restriction endonuclease